MITRRTLLKTGGLATLGTFTIGAANCPGAKDVSFYSATVIGALKDLRPLLPKLSADLEKAIDIAKAFDKAYQDGAFESAAGLFENLTTAISAIVAAAGVMNEQVTAAIAIGGIALRVIAALMRSEMVHPAVADAVAKSSNSSAKAMIERMGDPKVLNQIVELVKP